MSKTDELKQELKAMEAGYAIYTTAAKKTVTMWDEQIAALTAQIAEEAKPVLRHGQVINSPVPGPCIVIGDGEDAKVYCSTGVEIEPTTIGRSSYGIICESIFNDLKAMQEDVTEFKTKATGFSHNLGSVRIGDADDDLIFFDFASKCSDTCHMTLNQFEDHTMNCRKKLATLKRNEPKK